MRSTDRQELPEEDKSGSWHSLVTVEVTATKAGGGRSAVLAGTARTSASQSAARTHREVRTAQSVPALQSLVA